MPAIDCARAARLRSEAKRLWDDPLFRSEVMRFKDQTVTAETTSITSLADLETVMLQLGLPDQRYHDGRTRVHFKSATGQSEEK